MFVASPVHFPAEVLEEGGEPGLAGGLAAARAARQHQLPYLALLLLRLDTEKGEFHTRITTKSFGCFRFVLNLTGLRCSHESKS